MRIIAGNYKGYVIRPPKDTKARPTTDRAKESLFNILENNYGIEGKKVLDLFAGTGNVSFEFASRDAGSVTSVDISPGSLKFIRDVFKDLGYAPTATTKANAFSYLKKTAETYDIIFADPPYALPNIRELKDLVFDRNLLNENGLLIIEHLTGYDTGSEFLADQRKYGQSSFSFFAKKG